MNVGIAAALRSRSRLLLAVAIALQQLRKGEGQKVALKKGCYLFDFTRARVRVCFRCGVSGIQGIIIIWRSPIRALHELDCGV